MVTIDYKTVLDNCLSSDMTDDFSSDMAAYCDTVYGDILITVNGSEYGCIYDIPSEIDYGDTVLDYWFSELLEACIVLKHETKYIIKEIECPSLYLIFEKDGNSSLLVSCYSSDGIKWTEKTEYSELAAEVIRIVKKFTNELCKFNKKLADSAVISTMNSKLIKLEQEFNS